VNVIICVSFMLGLVLGWLITVMYDDHKYLFIKRRDVPESFVRLSKQGVGDIVVSLIVKHPSKNAKFGVIKGGKIE
jgi:hypothetical protein